MEPLREWLGIEHWIGDDKGNDALCLFLCHALDPAKEYRRDRVAYCFTEDSF